MARASERGLVGARRTIANERRRRGRNNSRQPRGAQWLVRLCATAAIAMGAKSSESATGRGTRHVSRSRRLRQRPKRWQAWESQQRPLTKQRMSAAAPGKRNTMARIASVSILWSASVQASSNSVSLGIWNRRIWSGDLDRQRRGGLRVWPAEQGGGARAGAGLGSWRLGSLWEGFGWWRRLPGLRAWR